MIAIIISLLLLVLSMSAQTHIAVVNLKAEGVSNQESSALTGRLASELFRTGKYVVLEREMLDKILDEQKFQLSGCSTNECLVQVGQLANVQQIVGGNISKVGKVFSVDARMVDVESGIIIATAQYSIRGEIGELMLQGMKEIAQELSNIQPVAARQSSESNQVNQKTIQVPNPISGEVLTKNSDDEMKVTHPEDSKSTQDEVVVEHLPTEEINIDPIVNVEPTTSGYTAGFMVGYPVYMSSGLSLGEAAPVFGIIFSTPFGFAVGPFEIGIGAELGMFDFSDLLEYRGIVAIATLNTALIYTPRGVISTELGGGYYGSSIGMTAGGTFSYAVPNIPIVIEPYARANMILDSGSNEVGSIAWINAGLYLSYSFK